MLSLAVDLGPPPADAHEQKAPVLKELGRLALEGVADKLKNPADYKYSEGVGPQAMKEDAGQKKWDGEQNRRNAERVAGPVYGMLMASGVLRDPLLVGAVAQHAEDDTPAGGFSVTKKAVGNGFKAEAFVMI